MGVIMFKPLLILPTHGVVATVKIPDGGTKEDVQAALDAVDSEID